MRVVYSRVKHVCVGCGDKIIVGEQCVQSQTKYGSFWHTDCTSDPKRRLPKNIRVSRGIERTERRTRTKSLLHWVKC